MSKAPDAFRTISEVAEDLDLPQHVLRFWETRFRQIKPLKRGGGRRYYRPDDVDLLKGIKFFLYEEGYTIKGVQKILREQGLRYLTEIGRGEEAPLLPERQIVQTHEVEPCEAESSDHELSQPTNGSHHTGEESGRSFYGHDDLFPLRPKAEPINLSRAEVSLLHSTLSELLECKRRLDALRL